MGGNIVGRKNGNMFGKKERRKDGWMDGAKYGRKDIGWMEEERKEGGREEEGRKEIC